MFVEFNSVNELVQVPPLPHLPNSINLHPLYLKSEVDRRKTFEPWRGLFMDVNQLADAGFFFTNWGDVVRCAFCGVEVGHWVEGVDNLRTIRVGVHLAGLLRGCLKETLLRLKHLNNLTVAMNCAGVICSIHQKPRAQKVVRIYLLLFIYFLLCIISSYV